MLVWGFLLPKKQLRGTLSMSFPAIIVVLYIVLGRLNRRVPWDVALADPAVNTLLQDAQVLLREVLE